MRILFFGYTLTQSQQTTGPHFIQFYHKATAFNRKKHNHEIVSHFSRKLTMHNRTPNAEQFSKLSKCAVLDYMGRERNDNQFLAYFQALFWIQRNASLTNCHMARALQKHIQYFSFTRFGVFAVCSANL